MVFHKTLNFVKIDFWRLIHSETASYIYIYIYYVRQVYECIRECTRIYETIYFNVQYTIIFYFNKRWKYAEHTQTTTMDVIYFLICIGMFYERLQTETIIAIYS